MFIPDLAFLQKSNRQSGGARRYLKRYFKTFLEKLSGILVSNSDLSSQLANKYPAQRAKFKMVEIDVGTRDRVLNYEEAEKVKSQHTGGAEYFLCLVTEASKGSFITILKAFSLFKKRQKSNMLLLFILDDGVDEEALGKGPSDL